MPKVDFSVLSCNHEVEITGDFSYVEFTSTYKLKKISRTEGSHTWEFKPNEPLVPLEDFRLLGRSSDFRFDDSTIELSNGLRGKSISITKKCGSNLTRGDCPEFGVFYKKKLIHDINYSNLKFNKASFVHVFQLPGGGMFNSCSLLNYHVKDHDAIVPLITLPGKAGREDPKKTTIYSRENLDPDMSFTLSLIYMPKNFGSKVFKSVIRPVAWVASKWIGS